MSEPVFTENIPVAEIRVGDNVRALIVASRPNLGCSKYPRNVRVKEIVGNIVRVGWRHKTWNVMRSDIMKAWGYR